MDNEIKWDGYRAVLIQQATGVGLLSRNLKDLTADYPHIVTAAPRVTRERMTLDGEIVALGEHGRPTSKRSNIAALIGQRWCSTCPTSCTSRTPTTEQRPSASGVVRSRA